MDDGDLSVRNTTYTLFVDLGRAPSAAEVADWQASTSDDVLASWRRLHGAHALVPAGSGMELLMANPFSAVPTPHRLAPSWTPHTSDQNQAILRGVGLTTPFWELP